MSDYAAAVRNTEKIKELLPLTLEELKKASDPELIDVLVTQGAVLMSMANPVTDRGMIQEVLWNGNGFDVSLRPVRSIPENDNFFENVWRGYRENKNIF